MGRGAVRRVEGGGGSGGGSNKLREELGLVHEATWEDNLRILKPYMVPTGWLNRARVMGCYVFLVLSKGCNIAAPAFLGTAVNKLTQGVLPLSDIITFTVLRFLVSVFEEMQKYIYLRVKEQAAIETATDVFAHLHSLSLSWHLSKRTGAVLRAADRGIGSASSVVDMLVLRLIPTCIEACVLIGIFAGSYGSNASAAVLAVTFVLYFIVTYAITLWRTKQRQKANLADNDATQIWSDSLSGFEVVKAFTSEKFELARYRRSVAAFQLAARQSQASLVTMNLSQSLLMRLAAGGVMIAVAYDTLAGRADVGAFVALQTWVAQLFTPLSWLGMLYGAVMTAMTDMGNLAALLSEKPAVTDSPGALVLPRHRGALSVEFTHTSFSYPSSRDRLDATMEHTRAALDKEDEEAARRKGCWGRLSASYRAWQLRRAGNEPLPSTSPSSAPGPNGSQAGTASSTTDVVLFMDVTSPGTSMKSPAGPSPGGPATPGRPLLASSSAVQGGAGAAPTSPGTGQRVTLQDVTFTIPPGKTLAVVGATGSGKSTLGRLLGRYYDVTGGRVMVGGHDVRTVTQDSLRAAIGQVSQDTFLFNDTIRFNIAYGKVADAVDSQGEPILTPASTEAILGVSQEDIETAARAAHIHDFIMTLPQKYETKVGERGLKLSGGEKQRVAIARAILKNPPILLLDEATSALDSLTEAEVQAAINAARRDRTVLVIAHRLSTIRDADAIVVLEGGCIVEKGTHEQLLEAGGKYASLWNTQAAMSAAAAATEAEGGEEGKEGEKASTGEAVKEKEEAKAVTKDAQTAGAPGSPGAGFQPGPVTASEGDGSTSSRALRARALARPAQSKEGEGSAQSSQ